MNLNETELAVVIEPAAPAQAAVVWLHGLGADGHDFVPIVPELALEDLAIRFVFPHAPVRPVTLNLGMRMRAWYDIPTVRDMRQQDEAGIRDSEKIVLDYLKKETDAGIPAERIFLAGFSQGGAIALHTGLRLAHRLGGIVALSTYVPIAEQFDREARAERRDTPVLMCHGDHDPMLPIELGTWSRDLLQEKGYTVEWHQYPMQHQVCAEEITDIGAFMRRRLTA